MTLEEDKIILTEINKERFKRRLSIFRAVSTRVIAILLVVAIIFVGVIQIKYAREVSAIKEKYGNNAYCYLCGKESLKRCECQYIPTTTGRSNLTAIAMLTAEYNTQVCQYQDSNPYSGDKKINLTMNSS